MMHVLSLSLKMRLWANYAQEVVIEWVYRGKRRNASCDGAGSEVKQRIVP